jgi:peroxiredoxin
MTSCFARFSHIWVGIAWVISTATVIFAANAIAPLPAAAQPHSTLAFSALTIDGTPVELSASKEPRLTVVCFVGTQCPLAKLYVPRLVQIAQLLDGDSVRWLAVASNRQDSGEDLREFAAKSGWPYPIIHDAGNQIADQFSATRTPEVFVLNERLEIQYQGRIDDQYTPGRAKAKATQRDLQESLTRLVAGKSVLVARTEPVGCLIGRWKEPDPQASVEFAEVMTVLQKRCIECHRDGEIAPFSLTEYDEVVGWADAMLESIDQGRMPPWHAADADGRFRNARQMPQSEKDLIRTWIAAGTPLGDQVVPEPPAYKSGWQLPSPPDLVLQMRERPFQVPATGTVEYQYFVVDPQFSEDRWVSAAQVIPGNAGVVHHCIVFIRPPDGGEFRGVGWLSGFVPGQRPFVFPPGLARKVPAGSKLVFQMHYTPNGTPQSDVTKIGLLFSKAEEVTHEVFTVAGIEQEFEIPPRATNHRVKFSVNRLPPRGQLLAIIPHMHVRGHSFQVELARGDFRESLLEVPRYDFNWQHTYELSEPISLADVSSLECTASFDNSAANVANPDPNQWVTWGDQTWEEMAVAFFAVAEPRQAAAANEPTRPASEPQVIADTATARVTEQKVKNFVSDFFARHDKNRDGFVEIRELPRSMQAFGGGMWDEDGDRKIVPAEVAKKARDRLR